MIVTSNDMSIRIYEKTPDILEDGIIKEYGIIREVLSVNLLSDDIPKNLKILVPMLGAGDGIQRFGDGAIYALEFNDNIYMEFTDIDTALNYFKVFIKMRDKEIFDIQTDYPEFFI
jgi:hypothetical protein